MYKNRILFTVTFLVSLGLIVGYKGSNLGFILVYVLGALFVISVVSIILAPLFVHVDEAVGNVRAAKNTKIKYNLNIKNRSFFVYPQIKLVFYGADIINYGSQSFENRLLPITNNKLEYSLSVPYRGNYRAGVKQIIVTDFLGLFRRKIKAENILVLTIYPQYNTLFELSIRNEAQRPDMIINYISPEDNTTVADIRQYQVTDSPKQIHWKLSAKRGDLLVKEYSPLITKKVAIFLDTRETQLQSVEKYKLEDTMISYVMSGVNYCIEEGLGANLILGRAKQEQKRVEHVSQIGKVLDLLAVVKLDEKESTIESLTYLPKEYNHVIYLSFIDSKVYGDVYDLKTYNNKTIIYYFKLATQGMSGEQKNILDSLKQHGVEVNIVSID